MLLLNIKIVIIKDLNLDINNNEFVGIVGPSGCGKSSLIKIICRLEQPTEGIISIDKQDLSNLSRHDIADIIALVPQNPFLVAGTIKENICYGLNKKVDNKEIKDAIEKAFLTDFISKLPNGYDTIIAEGGTNLSGGQRQRIAIARIFLSALDNTSEKYIQKEIEKFQKENNITIISIAHRLTTLENCDRILVFDKGKIVQTGEYHELIKTPGIFQDMYNGKIK